MNRLVASRTYRRTRGVLGVVVGLLGVAILYRIVTEVGPRIEALPGLVLGLAMIALGYVRVRAAVAAERP